jgi:hypothetical protein
MGRATIIRDSLNTTNDGLSVELDALTDRVDKLESGGYECKVETSDDGEDRLVIGYETQDNSGLEFNVESVDGSDHLVLTYNDDDESVTEHSGTFGGMFFTVTADAVTVTY